MSFTHVFLVHFRKGLGRLVLMTLDADGAERALRRVAEAAQVHPYGTALERCVALAAGQGGIVLSAGGQSVPVLGR